MRSLIPIITLRVAKASRTSWSEPSGPVGVEGVLPCLYWIQGVAMSRQRRIWTISFAKRSPSTPVRRCFCGLAASPGTPVPGTSRRLLHRPGLGHLQRDRAADRSKPRRGRRPQLGRRLGSRASVGCAGSGEFAIAHHLLVYRCLTTRTHTVESSRHRPRGVEPHRQRAQVVLLFSVGPTAPTTSPLMPRRLGCRICPA